ncbi:hypothetical protein BLNAU_3110 [Blattamonas nauphoetae]|uniref:Uncharacterized protein n=1 Tax=Blattamonas nauphoetae TaxID=2049346 RepID=A0ABQ9YE54_9EUKA|nr:hypothetical protein BLNAU_3110 [Blattamonas nauphoetae]
MLTHKSKTAEEMMILPPSSLRALHPVQVAEGRWSSRHPLREGSVVWAGDGAEAEGDGKDQHCSVGRCDRLEPFRLPKNKICTYPHPPNTHTRRTTNSRRLHSQAAVGGCARTDCRQTQNRCTRNAQANSVLEAVEQKKKNNQKYSDFVTNPRQKRSISEKGVNAGLVRTVGRSTAENSRFPTIDDPFTDINLGLDSDQLDTDAPEPLVPHQAEPPTLVKHTRLVARPPFSPPNFHSNNSIHLSILFVLYDTIEAAILSTFPPPMPKANTLHNTWSL